jgi:hypothetical protein
MLLKIYLWDFSPILTILHLQVSYLMALNALLTVSCLRITVLLMGSHHTGLLMVTRRILFQISHIIPLVCLYRMDRCHTCYLHICFMVQLHIMGLVTIPRSLRIQCISLPMHLTANARIALLKYRCHRTDIFQPRSLFMVVGIHP